jgi:glutathione S-transferase
MSGDYLFGSRPTVADFYLFVMLLWAQKFHLALPDVLASLRARTLRRPAVQSAMEAEGWIYPAPAAVGEMDKLAGRL